MDDAWSLILVKLLWGRDFLDHDAAGGNVPSIGVRTALESMATVSNHQSNTYGSVANPLTVSPDLTMLVNVGICSTMVIINNIYCFDGYGT